jgi:hypothetical protein
MSMATMDSTQASVCTLHAAGATACRDIDDTDRDTIVLRSAGNNSTSSLAQGAGGNAAVPGARS